MVISTCHYVCKCEQNYFGVIEDFENHFLVVMALAVLAHMLSFS